MRISPPKQWVFRVVSDKKTQASNSAKRSPTVEENMNSIVDLFLTLLASHLGASFSILCLAHIQCEACSNVRIVFQVKDAITLLSCCSVLSVGKFGSHLLALPASLQIRSTLQMLLIFYLRTALSSLHSLHLCTIISLNLLPVCCWVPEVCQSIWWHLLWISPGNF